MTGPIHVACEQNIKEHKRGLFCSYLENLYCFEKMYFFYYNCFVRYTWKSLNMV